MDTGHMGSIEDLAGHRRARLAAGHQHAPLPGPYGNGGSFGGGSFGGGPFGGGTDAGGFPGPASGQDLIELFATAPAARLAVPSPDGTLLAYVSDAGGSPQLWVCSMPAAELTDPGDPAPVATGLPTLVPTGDEPVQAVEWTGDGRWLVVQVAPGGGERTRVLAVRPDGADLRQIAGDGRTAAATLGHSGSTGALVAIAVADIGSTATGETVAMLADLDSGLRIPLAAGPAALVCDVTADGGRAVVRVGPRGARTLLLIDTATGLADELLPGLDATIANARFGRDGALLVHTDAGRELPALITVHPDRPDEVTEVAARCDAELEAFAVDRARRRAALVWNVVGRSELTVLDLATGATEPVDNPGDVITRAVFSDRGRGLLLSVDSPTTPGQVWRCGLPRPRRRLRTHQLKHPRPATRVAPVGAASWRPELLVTPELHHYLAPDGMALTGWLYRPRGAVGPMPTVLWLHGGPEAQERPAYNPLHQALVSVGVSVFAPNVRGSSGFGRAFVNADNHGLRYDAIADVAATVDYLVTAGLADPARVGCSGRSYGGYLTLAALTHYPELFRVGVNVCGIANFDTFFANTEPWIAASAVSKYGDPVADGELLRDLSPVHRLDRVVAPVMVVHGAHDTNVPIVEAQQVVERLERRGAAVRLLLFDDEGHEIHQAVNRVRFVREVAGWLTGHLRDADEQTA
jgi:dipeptidyl aminopeptidase/acylaminoacyl peptidase